MPDQESRTVREARVAIRGLEAALEKIHMAPASSLSATAQWYLRDARLKLRSAEREFAKADDPRLEPLKPLRQQLRDRRPSLRPRRRRYRCPVCFQEALLDADDLAYYEGVHKRCDAAWEPVARMKGRA